MGWRFRPAMPLVPIWTGGLRNGLPISWTSCKTLPWMWRTFRVHRYWAIGIIEYSQFCRGRWSWMIPGRWRFSQRWLDRRRCRGWLRRRRNGWEEDFSGVRFLCVESRTQLAFNRLFSNEKTHGSRWAERDRSGLSFIFSCAIGIIQIESESFSWD